MHQPGAANMPPVMNQANMSPCFPIQHPPAPNYQNIPASDKIDNVTKIKMLLGPLRESLCVTFKSAAQTLHQNNLIDTSKATDSPDHRFNKNMEEFQSVCDQIELYLKTAIDCLSQNSSAHRYLPVNIGPARVEAIPGSQETINYTQYLLTVKSQLQYAQEIHNALLNASQVISTSNE